MVELINLHRQNLSMLRFLSSPLTCFHAKEEEGKDRISVLPDCLLHHILSFLPTRDAARTCVLSSSWKTLFHTSPTLNIDDSNVPVKPSLERLLYHHVDYVTKRSNPYLLEFITKTVVSSNPYPLTSFSLGWVASRKASRDQFNSWISGALSRSVQQLHIVSTKVNILHTLPREVFLCRTLVVLKLNSIPTQIPANVCLPNLKVLHLRSFCYCDSSIRFLCGCLVLEEWVIGCYSVQASGIDFSLPTLKTLRIRLLAGKRTTETSILFQAPCLDRAEIGSILFWSTSTPLLFNGIRALKVLHLGNTRDMEPGYCFRRCCLPTLPHLTRLVIDHYDINYYKCLLYMDWNTIISILKSSIQLQELIFLKSSSVVFENFWPALPSCVSSHLREIVIKDFGGREEELKFIKYFLDQSRVLNRLTITSTSSMTLERELLVTNEIMSFHRSSSSCKIKLTRA